jgi:protocatechuate 3,4-dioxygenase beta subunit
MTTHGSRTGISRREVLGLLSAFGVTAFFGCGGDSGSEAATSTPAPSATPTPSPAALSCVVTPAETEGPFFVDERLNRSDLTSGTTNPAVVGGLPLTLRLAVHQVNGDACLPMAGAQVDVWHADALGTYSDEQSEGTAGRTDLRGYQLTDQGGAVRFQTVYPGWYPGRTVHIHFKIRTFASSGATAFDFTSQLYFDEAVTDVVFAKAPYNSRGRRDTTNAADMIYSAAGPDGAASGSHLMLAVEPASTGSGYVASFAIGLRTS